MNKKNVFFSMICFLMGFNLMAQEKVELTVGNKTMSKGEQMAITVFVPEANTKLVENQWKKFVNDRPIFEFITKGTTNAVQRVWIGVSNIFSPEKRTFNKNSLKVEKKGNEFVVKNVIHQQVTNDHLDIYAHVTQAENGVYLNSFFRYSDSVFINEANVDQDIITSLKSYIREFGVDTYKKVVDGQVKREEDVLKRMENDLKKLKNKNASFNNSISRHDSNIGKYNNNIWMINNDIYNIENQLSQLKDEQRNLDRKSVEYATLKKEIKQKSSERSKAYRSVKRQKSKIRKSESKIKNIESDIRINEREQDTQMKIIENQKLRIKEFETKRQNII